MPPVNIAKIDKENMRQVILDFPKQFRAGVEIARNVDISKYSRLRSPMVICGMGGSAFVGELLKLWLRHEYLGLSEHEVLVHRSYGLPKISRREYADGVWEPLIVVISYSGNTEEALSAYETARSKHLPLVAMATEGKLKVWALRDNVPFLPLPVTGIQPRSSFGYQFGALIALLSALDILPHETPKILALENALKPKTQETNAKTIAKKLLKKIPLIYTSDAWRELAQAVKIKFNEHAKHPAFWHCFPELNHNELNGFAELTRADKQALGGKFHLLIFEDAGDHPRIKKRMRVTAQMLGARGVTSTFLPIEGGTVLEKVFNTLSLGDWLAYYTAVLRKVDPTPVAMVEELKHLLK